MLNLKQFYFSITICTILLLSVSISDAQVKVAPQEASINSPYNTLNTHLHFLQQDSYRPNLSAKTIPPSVQDSAERVEMAIKLKQILDGKGLYVRLNRVPRDSAYKDSTYNQYVYTPFPTLEPRIYLERIDSKWYYSKNTISNIETLHEEVYPFGTDVLVDFLPEMGKKRVFGMQLWKYLGILLLLIIGYLLHQILSLILRPIVKRVASQDAEYMLLQKSLMNKIAGNVSMIFILWILRRFIPLLQLPVRWAEFANKGISIAIAVIIGALLVRVSRVFVNYLSDRAEVTDSKMDDQLIPILEHILKIIIIIIVVVYILHLMEVNVTALIAGVSIGGLALALAAQDTVKNLIGSVMIFLDKPFQIGDFVEINGEYGTITEVGFRTTRFKTKDTSIISIPNGELANMMVKNMGLRVFRLFETNIEIAHDTPPDLVEQYLEGLKGLIEIHPKSMIEDSYVFLTDIKAPALKIYFRTYLKVDDYYGELEVKEELFIGFIELADELNIDMPYPSTRLFIKEIPGQKGEKPKYMKGLTEEEREKQKELIERLRKRYNQETESDNSESS